MKSISVSSIDLADDLCRFGVSSLSKHLRRSLYDYGQLNPVILVSKGSKYRIIDGWKRVVFVVNELRGKTIEAKIVDSICNSKKDQVTLSYLLNHHRIGELEKAEILFRLTKCGELSIEEIVREYLPRLSLNPSYHNFRKYTNIAELESYIKELAYLGSLSFGHLEILADINEKAAIDAVVRFILIPYKLNVNESRDVINGIKDVATKNKKTVLQAVECVLKKTKTEAGSVNKNVFKSCIRKLRYPRLTYLEKRFSDIIKELTVSESTTVRYHPYFENNHLEIVINFDSEEKLLRAMDGVREILEKGKIGEALRLLKEGV